MGLPISKSAESNLQPLASTIAFVSLIILNTPYVIFPAKLLFACDMYIGYISYFFNE